MAKKWKALTKVQEEMCELGVELAKLAAFPSGTHPGRKKSLIPSVEDECADVLNAVEFFIERNGLNRKRIDARKAQKRRKFVTWYGERKPAKSKTSKKSPKA